MIKPIPLKQLCAVDKQGRLSDIKTERREAGKKIHIETRGNYGNRRQKVMGD